MDAHTGSVVLYENLGWLGGNSFDVVQRGSITSPSENASSLTLLRANVFASFVVRSFLKLPGCNDLVFESNLSQDQRRRRQAVPFSEVHSKKEKWATAELGYNSITWFCLSTTEWLQSQLQFNWKLVLLLLNFLFLIPNSSYLHEGPLRKPV